MFCIVEWINYIIIGIAQLTLSYYYYYDYCCIKVFDFAATDLLKVGENVHWGGGALEYMTLDSGVGTKGGLYYTSPPGSSKYGDDAFGNQFVQSEVSIEARDDDKARRLWELSEKLVNTASS